MRAGLRAAAVLLVAIVGACAPASGESGEVRTIELTIRHSRFVPDELEVGRGAAVRFVVHNLDPIDHELIVGDDEVHARHEAGTEEHHGTKPGEVSIPAGETAATTFIFDERGEVVYACHLPRHLDYGMTGVVRVR